MRSRVDRGRLDRFLEEIARRAPEGARAYLVGGATAVVEGWRDSTVDIDLVIEPESASEEIARAIPAIKEALDVNVEFAAPHHFVPELPDWRERSPSVRRIGTLDVRHYDPRSQALAKIERNHPKDRRDVAEMLRLGLVSPDDLRSGHAAMERNLHRYPALDPKGFRERLDAALARFEAPQPPIAPRRPHVETWHGEVRDDPWFWLREKENPAVREYLEAENRYAEAVLAPHQPVADALYREMVARIVETDVAAPYPIRGFEYFTRTYEGKQYPAHFRRRVRDGAPPPRAGEAESIDELLLDLNALASGEKFFSIGAMTVSDDDRYLAYSTDTVGFRQYRLHVKDLKTGAIWDRTYEKTVSIAWAGDGDDTRAPSLLFTVEDPAKRPYRLLRVRPFAATSGEPALVFEDNDERFNADVMRSRSGAFLFVISASHTTSEFHLLPAARPDGPMTLVAPRRHEHEYEVDHQGDRLLIRTNDRGRNFRLVETPINSPGEEHWRELVPHRADVMLEAVLAFEGHVVLCERTDGWPRFVSLDASGLSKVLPLPENPVYAAFPEHNRTYATTRFRINYQSLAVPVSSYEVDVASNTLRLLKETPIRGFDRTQYVTEKVVATAKDGTKVAVSVVRSVSTPLDGSAPMHLLGYGAYGFPYPVNFLHHRLSLLDRGFVIALAHVRGGGELGKPWHDAGKMGTKMNSFTDFIACAEELIARRFTSPERLVIEGGSAGGLLMGAVVNLRPDLFRAVIAKVPFVDAISSMLDETLPLTVGEFEEWGNPKIPENYAWMRAYCPISNLSARAYPAMLVRNSFNDSQVMYWEAAKYVAKMRTLKTNDTPLLLRTLMAAGHGGASGRYDALKDTSQDVAFILWQTGVPHHTASE